MNLRQLRQFVTLAETGNFRRAAEQLHMAQPPLSVSMRKLEEELGAPLFDRNPAGVVLTAAGEAMLGSARQTLLHAQQCQQSVQAAVGGEGGRLRLGIVGSATYSLLPRLISGFRKKYPQVELELTEQTTLSTLDGLEARRLDLGLVRYPVIDPRPFVLTPLERDEFVAALPARSRLARRAALPLAELADQPFIMYSASRVPGLFAMTMARCQQAGFTPRIAQEATQIQTILSLVQSGLGVALVAGVASQVVPAGVKLLRLSDNPRNVEIGLALVASKESTSRLVQTFTHHALATVAPA